MVEPTTQDLSPLLINVVFSNLRKGTWGRCNLPDSLFSSARGGRLHRAPRADEKILGGTASLQSSRFVHRNFMRHCLFAFAISKDWIRARVAIGADAIATFRSLP